MFKKKNPTETRRIIFGCHKNIINSNALKKLDLGKTALKINFTDDEKPSILNLAGFFQFMAKRTLVKNIIFFSSIHF